MTRSSNSQTPPKVMTKGMASLAFVPAVIFDAVRIFFEWFVVSGPAAAALYCSHKVGNVWLVGGLLSKGCIAGAIALGFAGSGATLMFGAVMAIVVGFAGWLLILIIILFTNRRIFRANLLWFFGSLVISEVPLLCTVPALSITVWRMYGRQMETETKALKKWQQEQAAAQLAQQNQQIMQQMQIWDAQQAQLLEQQEEAREGFYAEEQVREEEFAAESERAEDEAQNNVIPFPSKKMRGPVVEDEETPNKLPKAA